MIFSYGFSIKGKYHIENDICCQDSHCIKILPNGWHIAAIADGVSSSENSQIGSKIAVDTAVDFCYKFMPYDYNLNSIKCLIRLAFCNAYKQIINEAEKLQQPVESFDTTLSLAIYDGRRVIYGHAGDSSIIGLTTFGDYVEITKPQKGEDGHSVIPLRFGSFFWVIDDYNEDLVSVLLVTDGIKDWVFSPYQIKEGNTNGMYIPIVSFFADSNIVPNDEKSQERLKKDFEEFIDAQDDYDSKKFYSRLSKVYDKHIKKESKKIIKEIQKNDFPTKLMNKSPDDKTIVGLINTDVQLDDKNIEFYAEPNWKELQEKWNRKAYPHLYKDESDELKDE